MKHDELDHIAVLEYRKVDTHVTLLLLELCRYIKESFSQYAYVQTANEDNFHEILLKLCNEPAAINALDPQKAGFWKATDAISSITRRVVSYTGIVAGSTPFHRLHHLLYFSAKAKQLNESTKQLMAFAQLPTHKFDETTKGLFTQQSNTLINALKELFTTLEFLKSNDYSQALELSIANAPAKIAGMKGGFGGSKLATKITEIFQTENRQQLTALTTDIEKKSSLFLEKKETEKTESSLTQYSQQQSQVHAKEVAKANDERFKALQAKEQAEAELNKIKAEKSKLEQLKEQLKKQQKELELKNQKINEKNSELEDLEAKHMSLAIKEHQTRQMLDDNQANLHTLTQENGKLKDKVSTGILVTNNLYEKLQDSTLKEATSRSRIKEADKLDHTGLNSLHHAIIANNDKIACDLLNAGADANIMTKDKRSPLILALLDDTDSLRKHINEDTDLTAKEKTLAIVKCLLTNGANVNEISPNEQRSFVHICIFGRKKLSNRLRYKFRSSPNLELLELFLMHGCNLEAGGETSHDITSLLADKQNQSEVAKMLRTFHLFSASHLFDLMQSQYILDIEFANLLERSRKNETPSLSARLELPKMEVFYQRYRCVFQLFLDEKSRIQAVESISLIRKDTRDADAKTLEALIPTMHEKVAALRKNSPPQVTTHIGRLLKEELPKEECKTYASVCTIAMNIMKCIERINTMYTPRYQKNPTEICAITDLEARVIQKNLAAAKIKFTESQPTALTHTTSQAEAKMAQNTLKY